MLLNVVLSNNVYSNVTLTYHTPHCTAPHYTIHHNLSLGATKTRCYGLGDGDGGGEGCRTGGGRTANRPAQ
jgi:hypothetical protein